MTLTDWLKANHYSDSAFARLLADRLGRPVHASSVFQWKRGTMAAWDVGDAIREATGGKVTSGSFCGSKPSR